MSRNRKLLAEKINSTPELASFFGVVDMFDITPLNNGPRGDVFRWSIRGFGCITSIKDSVRKDFVLALSENSREIYAEHKDLM